MTKILRKVFYPQSTQWLNERSKNITATEIGALLGIDKYKSPAKILREKLAPTRLADNQWMRAGRLLEPSVFIALNEIGIKSEAAELGNVVMYINEDIRLSCTLDGVGKDADGTNFIVEAKSTNSKAFLNWSECPPLNYIAQAQVQILLTGYSVGLLACLEANFPFPLIVYSVSPNDELTEIIQSQVKKFWTCYETNVTFKVDKEIKERSEELLRASVEIVYG